MLIVAVGSALASTTPSRDPVDPQVGSGPPQPGLRDAQTEPAIAVDAGAVAHRVPANKQPLAVGANDYFDEAQCTAGCTFIDGVGVSGIYFSRDGGHSWTHQGQLARPRAYRGFTARNGAPAQFGYIATIPRFATRSEKRWASHGDPALAFGPVPFGPAGHPKFAWAKGSRLYYATLAQRFENPDGAPQVIAVSRTDNLSAAAAGKTSAWLPPVMVSHPLGAQVFADKPALWADNAASSRHFGNVYACWATYRSAKEAEMGNVSPPIVFIHSTNGGTTWSRPIFLASGQGCAIRTDSKGVVYVVSEGGADTNGRSSIAMRRSFDGGKTFEAQRTVTSVSEVGKVDSVLAKDRFRVRTFDGVLGARTNSWPSIDIANGAPSGKDENGKPAPDTIVVGWDDGKLDHERVLVRYSNDRGKTWSKPTNAAAPAPRGRVERPDLPAVAISPNGRMLYVVYTEFLNRWQSTLAKNKHRYFRGVMRAVKFSEFASSPSQANWVTIRPNAAGDARWTASAAGQERSLRTRAAVAIEFIGDFNSVAATNNRGYAVWVGASQRGASRASGCKEVSDFRMMVVQSPRTLVKPQSIRTRMRLNIRDNCRDLFGNTNLYSGRLPSQR